MTWFIYITCTTLCFLPEATDGICDGDSSVSDVYFTDKGTAPPGSPCCFPFIYQGMEYSECILHDNPRAWCSTDRTYEESNSWGNCVPRAAPGQGCIGSSVQSDTFFTYLGTVPEGTPCCFPFIYNQRKHNKCITEDNPLSWCSVNSVYHEVNRQWGNCLKIEPNAETTASSVFTQSRTTGPVRRSTGPVPTEGVKDGVSLGLIIGASVGAAAVLISFIISMLLLLCFCRKNRVSEEEKPATMCVYKEDIAEEEEEYNYLRSPPSSGYERPRASTTTVVL